MRYPEAGGSSSFARHAFNELVCFGAAWAQMLNYIITIAISAFFVPHYLSIFWEPLKTNPWDIVGGIVVIVDARRAEHRRDPGGGAAQHRARGPRLRDAAPARRCSASCSSSARTSCTRNIHWGVAPTWGNFALAIPVAMIAYTGIETVSNLAEEARDPPRDIPRVDLPASRSRSSRSTSRCRSIALSALPVKLVDGEYKTLLGAAAGAGRLQERPGARARRATSASTGVAARRAQDLRRHARRDDPLHRDERRRDRRVADHVLDGELPAAPGGLPARCTRASRRRGSRSSSSPGIVSIVAILPGQGRLPRDDVLVRRDALVHGRARRR